MFPYQAKINKGHVNISKSFFLCFATYSTKKIKALYKMHSFKFTVRANCIKCNLSFVISICEFKYAMKLNKRYFFFESIYFGRIFLSFHKYQYRYLYTYFNYIVTQVNHNQFYLFFYLKERRHLVQTSYCTIPQIIFLHNKAKIFKVLVLFIFIHETLNYFLQISVQH